MNNTPNDNPQVFLIDSIERLYETYITLYPHEDYDSYSCEMLRTLETLNKIRNMERAKELAKELEQYKNVVLINVSAMKKFGHYSLIYITDIVIEESKSHSEYNEHPTVSVYLSEISVQHNSIQLPRDIRLGSNNIPTNTAKQVPLSSFVNDMSVFLHNIKTFNYIVTDKSPEEFINPYVDMIKEISDTFIDDINNIKNKPTIK
ncbi:MAG: hypothetical protein ACRDD8_15325 [Bacteroidales bacterium]